MVESKLFEPPRKPDSTQRSNKMSSAVNAVRKVDGVSVTLSRGGKLSGGVSVKLSRGGKLSGGVSVKLSRGGKLSGGVSVKLCRGGRMNDGTLVKFQPPRWKDV
jgi:hypothetical protein